MSASVTWFVVLILLTGAERLWEVRLSNLHARWAFERGGREFGQAHYPYMVVLHTGLLLACIAEVVFGGRPFIPWLGWPMLAIAIACQGLRYWCILTLGRQWNARVIVVPGLGRVTRGPYRFLTHPNYVVVIVEGIALPLVHTAWITALAFTVLNAVLLFGFRIPTEERALAWLDPQAGSSRA
jgi:methyltransferase